MVRTQSLATLILFGVAGIANAGLVDYYEPELGYSDDGVNLTLHEETGFSWLDIDLLANWTLSDVQATLLPNPPYVGFVVATRDQVKVFLDALGMQPYSPNWPSYSSSTSGAALAALNAAVSHVGKYSTSNAPDSNFIAAGYVTDDTSDPTTNYVPYIERKAVGGFTNTNVGGTWEVSVDTPRADVGTWVYRPAVVPEPSTFSMLAFCGIAMAGYSRLRRRRK